MQSLVNGFSDSGKLEVNLFSDTSGTTKASSKHLRHRRFVVCKDNAECFAASMKTCVEKYVIKSLDEKSNISSIDEMMDPYQIVV